MTRYLLAALTLAALAQVPAQAGETRVRTVRTADLDLSRPADLRKLDRRIAGATEAVCGSYAGAREHELDRIARCRSAVAEQVAPAVAASKARSRTMASR